MKLVKLLPEQVEKVWHLVEYAIQESVPPTVAGDVRVLAKTNELILEGRMDVWIAFEEEVEKISTTEKGTLAAQVLGVVITTVYLDVATGFPTLLIWALASLGNGALKETDWSTGIQTLKQYATAKGCSRVIAFTDNPGIVSLSKKLGADVRFVLTFEV